MNPLGWAVAGDGPDVRADLLPQLTSSEAATVAAVFDPEPEARSALGALAPSAVVTTDPEALLGAAGVEAVRVSRRLPGRAALVRAAARARIPALIEPPLASTAAESTDLVADFAPAATLVATDFLPRWHPAHLVASDEIDGEIVGAVSRILVVEQTADDPLPGLLRGADLVGMLLGDDIVDVVVDPSSRVVPAQTALRGVTRRGVEVELVQADIAAGETLVEVVGATGTLAAVGTLGPLAGGRLLLRTGAEELRDLDFPADLSPITVSVDRFSRAVRGAGPWGYSIGRDLRLFRLVEAALAEVGAA